LPAAEAAKIFSQIADALDFIHRAGRIHRDLKPSNVMMTPAGRVKLLDFGISKRLVADAAPEPAEVQAGGQPATRSEWLTGHAGVLGTLPYMSPEQLRGAAIDERADLWAFGVMLYEALAGSHPFIRKTPEDTRAAILAVEPDWKALPGRTPAETRTLLRLCLEKDAPARLREAAEAGRVLTQGASPSPRSLIRNFLLRQSPLLALLAALIVLAGASLVALSFIKPKVPPSAKRFSLAVTHREDDASSGSCEAWQRGDVVAGILINRLKGNPQLIVYQPRIMPAALPLGLGSANHLEVRRRAVHNQLQFESSGQSCLRRGAQC
jgi:serine/threonine protein kinase